MRAKIKSSENDKFTGHFQSFFLNISRADSKSIKVNQQSDNESADQSAHMRRLICTFVIRLRYLRDTVSFSHNQYPYNAIRTVYWHFQKGCIFRRVCS